jgi:hypothetical protein
METPTTLHPITFEIGGYFFQVVSYSSLTNDQAAKIAEYFYRTHKLKKKDKGSIIKVVTLLEGESLKLL